MHKSAYNEIAGSAHAPYGARWHKRSTRPPVNLHNSHLISTAKFSLERSSVMSPNVNIELDQQVAYGLERNRVRVVRRWQLDSLVGKLLTYIDATYNDPEQRKAHKDIVKQSCYNWFMDVHSDYLEDGVSYEEALEEVFAHNGGQQRAK